MRGRKKEAFGQVNPQLLEWLRTINPTASEDRVSDIGTGVNSIDEASEGVDLSISLSGLLSGAS